MKKPVAPSCSNEPPTDYGGSGGGSLAGYEYQIDVSVWFALDLVLADKLTQELILEPSSQEDLEADLQDHEPGHVTSAVLMDGYRLVVQAKRRTGDAWSVSAIKALLKHGSDSRVSAAERLSDADIRYLLVTSAALNGGSKGLRVRRAGVWPKGADMPVSIVKALPVGAAGRVAVMGNQDEEHVSTHIQRLLTENFRVPNARWKQCWHALREEARIRILGGNAGRWQRVDLEQVIRAHEGYIASSPELEHYVFPTNWGDLTSMMARRHAALIVGQSGTGKTLTTRKLYEELREEIPGLSRVPITRGPGQLLSDQTEPPVMYDIEDPWGRFDFDPNSRPWNDQLSNFFARATHDRMIIATSRFDVAQASGALESVKSWNVSLEAEHYGRAERHRLYTTRIEGLPRTLRRIAIEAEGTVLAELGTPLEIQKFFDALPNLNQEELKNARRLITEAIRQAHHEAIERTVIEQVRQRQDVPAAAVLWGLLKGSTRLSLRVLRSIEEGLEGQWSEFSKGIIPLAACFVAARNLRQTEDTVTYYHPRVESGIEQALSGDRLVARKALRLLVEVLTSEDGPDQTWGTGVAVRLIAAVGSKLSELNFSPSVAAQVQIDTWLATQADCIGTELEANLRFAAAAGSKESTVSELARFLLHRPESGIMGWSYWKAPERDVAWYTRLREAPSTGPLLDAFVRHVLPAMRVRYPRSLATDLARLSPSLTSAFLDAAQQVVHFGVIQAEDAIVEGALNDLESFEAILDMAITVRTPSAEEQQRIEEQRLAIVNGEYSDEYVEYLANDDDGYTAGEFLEAYVKRIRGARNWRLIAEHRHAAYLQFYWLRELANGPKEVSPDPTELEGAIAAAYGGTREDMVWGLLQQFWQPSHLDRLIERVQTGHDNPRVREAALACLIEHAPQELKALLQVLAARQGEVRMSSIAIELAQLHHRYRKGEQHASLKQAIESVIAALPPPLDTIAASAIALEANEVPTLPCEAHAFLSAITNGDAELRRFRLKVDRHVPLPVEDDVCWLLANTDDDDVAAEAVDAAVRHGMEAEIKSALGHRFAQANARALTAIAQSMPAPLPASLLQLAEAKGSFVRTALVKVLDAKPHPAHMTALLRLVKDSWSTSWTSHGEPAKFPIARAAVVAIAKLGPLAADVAEQLLKVGIESTDTYLRFELFELVAKESEGQFLDRLFELAVTPGRPLVQHAAASALLGAAERVPPALLACIDADLLTTRAEPIAVRLTILLAWGAQPHVVAHVASAITTQRKRRVLVLVMIWLMKDRDQAIAKQMAALLPGGHAAVKWALGEEDAIIDDAALADLGDPLIVAEVLGYMSPSPD